MYFGTQEVNIEVNVSVKEETTNEVTIKLNKEGTALLHKYVENLNKIQPEENFTIEKALKMLILNGFGKAFTIGHLQNKDIAEIKGI